MVEKLRNLPQNRAAKQDKIREKYRDKKNQEINPANLIKSRIQYKYFLVTTENVK